MTEHHQRPKIGPSRVMKTSVQDSDKSAFMTMWRSQCEASLTTWTGFNRNAIEYMLGVPTEDVEDVEAFKRSKFQRLFDMYSVIPRDGRYTKLQRRARILSALQCLCLVLTWTRSQGPIFTLAGLFGVTTSSSYNFLQFGRRVLLRVLASDEKAKIKLPTADEVAAFKAAVVSKYPALTDVCLVADGLKSRWIVRQILLPKVAITVVGHMATTKRMCLCSRQTGQLSLVPLTSQVQPTIPLLPVGEAFITSSKFCTSETVRVAL